MPATIDLLFYVALAGGTLMLLAASLVYVLKKEADRGTLGFCLIGALLITIGVIANLKVSWDEKGGNMELATTRALEAGISTNSETVDQLMQAQQQQAEKLQVQLEAFNKRQDEMAAVIARLQQSDGGNADASNPPLSAVKQGLADCSPQGIEERKHQRAELLLKDQTLQRQIDAIDYATYKGQYKITVNGVEISGPSLDSAIRAQRTALRSQQSAVRSLLNQLAFQTCSNTVKQ